MAEERSQARKVVTFLVKALLVYAFVGLLGFLPVKRTPVLSGRAGPGMCPVKRSESDNVKSVGAWRPDHIHTKYLYQVTGITFFGMAPEHRCD